MIIFFGAPGAGKSVQGRVLVARHGWYWLSAGQMLRDSHDPEVAKKMSTGGLVDNDTTNNYVSSALARVKDAKHVVLDGFPRELSQAKWLVENQPHHGRSISLAIVLEVSDEELARRLKLRARPDDTPASAKERIAIYHRGIKPIIDYLKEQKIPIVHISGEGTVGDVHDRIESELSTWSLV